MTWTFIGIIGVLGVAAAIFGIWPVAGACVILLFALYIMGLLYD